MTPPVVSPESLYRLFHSQLWCFTTLPSQDPHDRSKWDDHADSWESYSAFMRDRLRADGIDLRDGYTIMLDGSYADFTNDAISFIYALTRGYEANTITMDDVCAAFPRRFSRFAYDLWETAAVSESIAIGLQSLAE